MGTFTLTALLTFIAAACSCGLVELPEFETFTGFYQGNHGDLPINFTCINVDDVKRDCTAVVSRSIGPCSTWPICDDYAALVVTWSMQTAADHCNFAFSGDANITEFFPSDKPDLAAKLILPAAHQMWLASQHKKISELLCKSRSLGNVSILSSHLAWQLDIWFQTPTCSKINADKVNCSALLRGIDGNFPTSISNTRHALMYSKHQDAHEDDPAFQFGSVYWTMHRDPGANACHFSDYGDIKMYPAHGKFDIGKFDMVLKKMVPTAHHAWLQTRADAISNLLCKALGGESSPILNVMV